MIMNREKNNKKKRSKKKTKMITKGNLIPIILRLRINTALSIVKRRS